MILEKILVRYDENHKKGRRRKLVFYHKFQFVVDFILFLRRCRNHIFIAVPGLYKYGVGRHYF